jgi:hypothetical protein
MKNTCLPKAADDFYPAHGGTKNRRYQVYGKSGSKPTDLWIYFCNNYKNYNFANPANPELTTIPSLNFGLLPPKLEQNRGTKPSSAAKQIHKGYFAPKGTSERVGG